MKRLCFLAAVAGCVIAFAADTPGSTNSYARWPRGPSSDPAFFPLAVWLQAPANAERYRRAGINTYVGLWRGPTEEQLSSLERAGMRLICEQNQTALGHLDDPIIIGWMHGDEPDNAQALENGKGYGPPIPTAKIIEDYERMRAADPARPVMLNLGQGVAWDGYYGRGVRTNHPEDYAEYLKGCDIASFDIYPVVHERAEVAGKLWFVPRGVERLIEWGGGQRVVWNCLECTRISNPDRKATPEQVRAEAWMSLIHGSRGLIYFVHQFKPVFREAALLDDAEMLAAVTALNRQIIELAPALNSPSLADVARVKTENDSAPVDLCVKRSSGALHIFAVAMRGETAAATFQVKGLAGETRIEVLGENRSVQSSPGKFTDHFAPWQVHLYKLPNSQAPP